MRTPPCRSLPPPPARQRDACSPTPHARRRRGRVLATIWSAGSAGSRHWPPACCTCRCCCWRGGCRPWFPTGKAAVPPAHCRWWTWNTWAKSPPPPPAVPPPPAAPAASRLRTTPVVRAEERAERESPEASEALRVVELPPRETRPEPPAPVTPPHPPARRSAYLRGMPPGLLPEDQAPVNAGTAPSPDVRPGPRYQADASESELEAGGYQVIYDLIAERRVREWRDAGMTEVYMPLPGTRRLMACPLEIVMRRSSGPCRLVEPDDPALANIGDAREVLSMLRIYHRGQPVWRGPGPYR